MASKKITVCVFIAVFFIFAALVGELIKAILREERVEKQLLDELYPLQCNRRMERINMPGCKPIPFPKWLTDKLMEKPDIKIVPMPVKTLEEEDHAESIK